MNGELPLIDPGTSYWSPGPVTPPAGLPIITPGRGWHVGPQVGWTKGGKYWQPEQRFYGDVPGALAPVRPFTSALRFGAINSSVMVAAIIAGMALDKPISQAMNIPEGWGPVLGAASANAVSTTVAGLSEGVEPSLGMLVGAVVPIVPLVVAAYALRARPTDLMTQGVVLGSAALIGVAAAAFLR